MRLALITVILVVAAGFVVRGDQKTQVVDDSVASDEALVRQAGFTTDGAGLLAFFRKRSPTDEDRQHLQELVRKLGSGKYKERQQAIAELRDVGPAALPFIRSALKDSNLETRSRARNLVRELDTGVRSGPGLPAAAARLLVLRHPASAVAALLTYFPYVDDEYLQDEVLMALGRLAVHQGKIHPLLATAVHDRLAFKRAAAGQVLGRMGGPRQRATVRKLLADPDARVRQLAAEALIGKEYYRQADQNAEADEALLRQMKVDTDAAGLIDFLRKRTLSEEDRKHLQELVRQLGDPLFRKRQQATRTLMQLGTTALPFLRPALHDTDLELVRRAEKIIETIETGPNTALPMAAARLLVRRRPPDAVKVLIQYLPSADDDTVAEAVLASLCRLSVQDEKLDPALGAALRDAASARRAAAAYVLARVGTQEDCRAAGQLLEDADDHVRFRAAEGMIFAQDKRAVPVLLALLGGDTPDLAVKVEEVLRQLAGDRAPVGSVAEGMPEERAKSRAAWLAWWQSQADKVDLARLSQRPAELGLTVICEFDSVASGGQAWEFGRDFKPRWKLTNLQGPMDVHVLGEDRLLIAEYYGRRVTERNKKGDILWEYSVGMNQYPVACSRMANGNTFIATYTNLIEVTPAKKEVHNYNRSADGQIYSAQKLRNGHMVYMTSTGWVVTLNGQGNIVHRFNVGTPGAWCGVEWLTNGHLIVTQMASGKIQEVDAATGKHVYWETTVVGAHQTLRLSNGNTMVVCMNNRRLVEVNHAKKVLWDRPMEGRPWRVHRR